jgi:hypothetical protein
MFGNLSTAKYFYSASMVKKFSTLDQLHQLETYHEAQSEYRWPISRLDTNSAFGTACGMLAKIEIDVSALNHDCTAEVITIGGQGAYFIPIYCVIWRHSGKRMASFEFLEPTLSIRHINIRDGKYILRPPLTTTNLRQVMIEGGASPSLLKTMESRGAFQKTGGSR